MLTSVQSHLDSTRLLPRNSRIIVAVSGGIDSVVLLDLLAHLKPAWGWELIIAHVDHKARPDSNLDAVFVAKLADQYKLPFHLGQLSTTSKSEASMRQGRYDFLESIRRGEGADLIVTAHHGDDRIETAALNLIRGADRSGIVALQSLRGHVARPLLSYSRGDILTYATMHKLDYRDDPTNSSPRYRRNVLRHQVLAQAPVTDPHYRTNLLSKLDQLQKMNTKIDYGLDRLADQLCDRIEPDEIVISRVGFAKLPDIVKLNLFVHLVKKIDPSIELTRANIDVALNFNAIARTGSARELRSGLKISRSYDTLVVSRKPDRENKADGLRTHLLRAGSRLSYGDFILHHGGSPSSAVASVKLLPTEVYIRSWQPGDRIYPTGMTGSRKLQDIFVDTKIPRHARALWPVVVNRANQVMWVPRLAVDRRFSGSSEGSITLVAKIQERI